MQATIYVTEQAMAVAIALRDLGYFERSLLSDDPQTDLSTKEGYYLKNASKIKLGVLPSDAVIGVRLTPSNPDLYSRHVSIPSNLRGCIFENAPNIPAGYAANVTFWSGHPLNTNTCGSAYFQNPQQSYMIDLSPLDASDTWSPTESCDEVDQLISEGIVVCIDNVQDLISSLGPDHFIELQVPAQPSMLGYDPEEFRSLKEYQKLEGEQFERVFIKVSDIENSPDPDRIQIDLLRYELLDYGWTY